MLRALIEAKRILNGVTPLSYDCGGLCENACCKPDSDGQGRVTLFPGEDEELEGIEWGVVEDGYLTCSRLCDRNLRPMGCRIFPLSPAVKKDGTWTVRMDSRAKAACPLYRFGAKGLDAQFAREVKRAFNIMARDETLDLFLRDWEKDEREFDGECKRLAGGKNA